MCLAGRERVCQHRMVNRLKKRLQPLMKVEQWMMSTYWPKGIFFSTGIREVWKEMGDLNRSEFNPESMILDHSKASIQIKCLKVKDLGTIWFKEIQEILDLLTCERLKTSLYIHLCTSLRQIGTLNRASRTHLCIIRIIKSFL